MKYENKCLGDNMFLNDLKNKEQEHTDIKNILEKDYGYTIKDPVYGNSVKKVLQQVQDAKQELYRDFNLAEYNRVVLFEQYLKQLIERKVPGRTPTKSKEDETEKYTLPTLIDPESGKLISSSGDDKDLKFYLDEDYAYPKDLLKDIKYEWKNRSLITEPKEEKEGLLKRGIKKVISTVNPFKFGAPDEQPQSKIETPPLDNTPMPIRTSTHPMKKDPITNLTRTETALLSPKEKVIAGRT